MCETYDMLNLHEYDENFICRDCGKAASPEEREYLRKKRGRLIGKSDEEIVDILIADLETKEPLRIFPE